MIRKKWKLRKKRAAGLFIFVSLVVIGLLYAYLNSGQTIDGVVIDTDLPIVTIVTDQGEVIEVDTTDVKTIGGDEILVGYEILLTYRGIIIPQVTEEPLDVNSIEIIKAISEEDFLEFRSEQILETMSLEEKIGQMFMVRFPDGTPEVALKALLDFHFGGFILYDKDIKDRSPIELTDLIAVSQEDAKLDLFIAIDEEGGGVNRLSRYVRFRSSPFPSPQELFADGGFELIIADTLDKASFLKNLGFNLNMAPVADVSIDPNDYIYPRTFGQDAYKTADYVRVVVDAMHSSSIGSVLKHFPGYGNNFDTHIGFAVDDRSYENFTTSDFIPFIAGIEANADSVLVSHTIVPSMDPVLPASLSPSVHAILRDTLGFKGVIFCDDLMMNAIEDSDFEKDPAVLAVLAGNDMIITKDYEIQIPSVIAAVNLGDIQIAQIDASVSRILIMKLKLGIIR